MPKSLPLSLGDYFLQRVAVLAGNPDRLALDRGLNLYFASLMNFTTSLAFSIGIPCWIFTSLANSSAGGRLDLLIIEGL